MPNPGHLPPECEIIDELGNVTGHRDVHVRLFNGWESRSSSYPAWPSKGGRPYETNWKISRPPHPGEIMEFELA